MKNSFASFGRILFLAFFFSALFQNASAQYCTTGLYSSGCTSGDDVGTFKFNTITNITNTCPGGNSGYADYTAMSTTVQAGSTYTVQVGTSSTSWSQGFGVWIDYNHNFSFADAGEFVYASPTFAAAPTIFTGTVTISPTALSGPTRLRVRGNYNATYTASQSCNSFTFGETEDYTVVINNITATASTTGDGCPGDSTGTATVNLSGGTPPFTYLWNDWQAQTTATATGLAAGTYSVAISDSLGATATQTVVIYSNISVTVSATTDVTCFGASNGTATASISGTAPYTYLWSNGQTTQTATGLAPGIYTVTATDSSGCTNWAKDTITQPAALASTFSITAQTCVGNNGTATVNVTGGTAPYSYLWSNSQTTQTATGLASGTYTVVITDTNSCTRTATATVNNIPFVTSISSTPQSCSGGNGTATTNATSGGTAPYTYSWSNGQTTQVATGLSAGGYTVVTTDSVGCTSTKTVTITTTPFVTSVSATQASCNGSNGTATSTPTSGGTSPYTYLWSTTPAQSTQIATGLTSGNYTVLVTDAMGCTSTRTVNVTSAAFNVTTSTVPANCNGGGSATANSTGGAAPYTYAWSNGQTAQTATGLAAGTYTVVVTEANGCTDNAVATVSSIPPLNLTSSSTPVSCFGGSNATATATPSGGTAPYTYAWSTSPVQTTQTAVGLGPGTYSVLVTDANGCTQTATFSFTSPSYLFPNTSSTAAGPPSFNNGTASVVASGGTPP